MIIRLFSWPIKQTRMANSNGRADHSAFIHGRDALFLIWFQYLVGTDSPFLYDRPLQEFESQHVAILFHRLRWIFKTRRSHFIWFWNPSD